MRERISHVKGERDILIRGEYDPKFDGSTNPLLSKRFFAQT